MEMNFKRPENLTPFPQKVKVVQWDKGEAIYEENRELHFPSELDALLQEVKQFNCDPDHIEHGIYKTIINH